MKKRLAFVGRDVRSDLPRNRALHVTMRDGVRIAIDVWLPVNLDDGAHIPTLMHATRYWRARQHR